MIRSSIASSKLVLSRRDGTTSFRLAQMFSTNSPIDVQVVPREIRKKLRDQSSKSKATPGLSLGSIFARGSALLTALGAGYWIGYLDEESKKKITSMIKNSFLQDAYKYMEVQIAEVAKPFTEPSREKLLPDWPMPGFGIPVGAPPPPTLILDLEDTLVHSDWDRRHGWRHAKRPGVDKFLETLSRYYEIVIFSKQAMPSAEETIVKLDKNNCAMHHLYKDSTRFMNGNHVKDITNLNRPLERAIIIDDDPTAYQLHIRNAIPVKPFTDSSDITDTELTDLIPLLVALASENVKDYREVLDRYRDEDGNLRDLSSKYKAQVHAMEVQAMKKKQKGLGGFLRSSRALPIPPPKTT